MKNWRKWIAVLLMSVMTLGIFLSTMGVAKAEPQEEETAVVTEDAAVTGEESTPESISESVPDSEPESGDPEIPADSAAEEPEAEDPADTEDEPAVSEAEPMEEVPSSQEPAEVPEETQPADEGALMPRSTGYGNSSTLIESISLPDSFKVPLNGSATLTATIKYKSSADMANLSAVYKEVNWSADYNLNGAISFESTTSTITIDKTKRTGTASVKIYGNTTGMPIVYATAFVTKAYCEVSVSESTPITGLSLEKTSVGVLPGKTVQLNPVFTPSNTTETGLTWTSSNTAIATVDSSGVVTGVKNGTVTITAKSTVKPKISATCTVKVSDHLCGDNL